MKKQENTKSISRLAFERTRKTFSRKTGILALLFLILTIVVALGYFMPLTLLITVPMVAMPSLFAFMSINTIIDTDLFKNDKHVFFLMFKNYFSSNFFGGNKILTSFLWSLLIEFIAILVSLTVGGTIFLSINPTFMNEMNEILSGDNIALIEENLLNFLTSNNGYMNIILISSLIGSSFGTVSFIHFSLSNGVKFYFNLLGNAPIPSNDLNLIYKFTLKKIKKEYWKDYYKSIWFIPLLMILGYVGGCLFATIVFVNSGNPAMIGVFCALVLVLFFIPYYFDLTLILFNKYRKHFYNTFIDLSMESLKEMQKNAEVSEEKQKEIKDFLDSQKDNLDNDDKEDEKNKKPH